MYDQSKMNVIDEKMFNNADDERKIKNAFSMYFCYNMIFHEYRIFCSVNKTDRFRGGDRHNFFFLFSTHKSI